ncbi:uncharacterized protein LOC101453433 [Ceratitis capitata]|uniref:uncharacterized protein LOC101453433 n=1 Tax=Ceratitis capitata TaxID=7213 RepID=UPI0006188A17|nr:uncharacterized protein LOC101453433 [Ceratitis capitata]
MPGSSVKKQSAGSNSAQKNTSNSSIRNISSGSSGSSRARKRKRCVVKRVSDSDLESELEECNLEDAVDIERKLRKVAEDNHLSDEEMRKLLQKFVKNEHILALVTLKAEDEIARERQESEQPAIIITDTPSVPKLTRAKARELNKIPGISLPSLTESKEPEITALIQEELNSDEDDEEYVFKEDDFVSDEDPNTTASDLDSNPRTPQTPLSQTEAEDSPVKFTSDGCFKIPFEKPRNTSEDVRIAARTRSKLCLEQTAIEDIESEFVPPDVEQIDLQDIDMTANDEDWMQFLNDFTKPLNSSFITDDDDPVNDPEYIAAEKILEDAEELRDINIPRKELTELVAELFEGLVNEGVSLESVELDTPQNVLLNTSEQATIVENNNVSISAGKILTPATTHAQDDERHRVTRQLNFEQEPYNPLAQEQNYVADVPPLVPISNIANVTQNEYSFQPDVMSTPAAINENNRPTAFNTLQLQAPVAYPNNGEESVNQVITLPATGLNAEPEWIAVKIPGLNNSYQLARVVPAANTFGPPPLVRIQSQKALAPNSQQKSQPTPKDPRYTEPYDTNFTYEYISIRKHVYTEYISKFEDVVKMLKNTMPAEELPTDGKGFTRFQHDILQQQLRLHVQMLTQTFVQSYSHPNYWKLAPKAKDMLMELEQKAEDDASFRAWNLRPAMKLIRQWEEDLSEDTPQNKEMMKFINSEVHSTRSNCRQVPRFPPRIMELMLNSKVFMYPQYLPRIPFRSRPRRYECFAPAEMQLIAMGLERHINKIRETGERLSNKTNEVRAAVRRLITDTVYGKSIRRVWGQVRNLRHANFYNPVKFYFEHKRAPPIEHKLITFENSKVLPPKDRYEDLPLAWQTYIDEKRSARRKRGVRASETAGASYLQFVREALGEDIQLPDSAAEAATPNDSGADNSRSYTQSGNTTFFNRSHSKRSFANSVTINVNYYFGATPTHGETQANANATLALPAPETINGEPVNASELACTPLSNSSPQGETSIVSFNYDWNSKTLRPIIEPKLKRSSPNLKTIKTKREKKVTTRPCKLVQYKRIRNLRGARRTLALSKINKRLWRKRFTIILKSYRLYLTRKERRFKRSILVRNVYRYFKALELYTNLLRDLKMACRNAIAANLASVPADNTEQLTSNTAGTTTTSQHSPTAKFFIHGSTQYGKRTRTQLAQQQALDEDSFVGSRSKKASRQEENFKHMLLPDTAEDANRKDAIYAFNFYEKVEEVFKASNRPEDCKRFNHILKTFDPRRDKVSDLYNKMERLFLPEFPELAQVFLTFLLPSEAAEIGKFFEYFMINNMTTFINKLNIYFNKQPAQIRKIYNCLAELAEEPEVTMKKVEAKILPLLKGNQFLIEWFLQQFPEAKPPERLLSTVEQVNLKEAEIRPNSHETLNDPPEAITPCCEMQQQQQQNQAHQCQLRYINGRIFYGNKITLPAKLSFMASNAQSDNDNECDADELSEQAMSECVHGIREHGERRLAAVVDKAAAADCNPDDNDISEEEDVTKTLLIDTENHEDTTSSIETCDDAALRAHAMRLNPAFYGNTCFAAVTSTPNAATTYVPHHPNAKKSMLNFNDDGKVVSPRKQLTPGASGNTVPASVTPTQCLSPNITAGNTSKNQPTTTMANINALNNNAGDGDDNNVTLQQQREKRKLSPTKKVKSPLAATRLRSSTGNAQPMVVIYEHNAAIACAKKLQSLIAEEDNEGDIDNKERIAIIARAKDSMPEGLQQDADESVVIQVEERRAQSPHTPPLLTVTKVEHSDNSDDLEFIPEGTEVTHSLTHGCFERNISEYASLEQIQNSTVTTRTTTTPAIDVQSMPVATANENYTEDCKLEVVATLSAATEGSNTAATCATSSSNTAIAASKESIAAWTREEDKLILIEMKLSAGLEREQLLDRIHDKLPTRTLTEIKGRYHFLMDFLSKLQGK